MANELVRKVCNSACITARENPNEMLGGRARYLLALGVDTRHYAQNSSSPLLHCNGAKLLGQPSSLALRLCSSVVFS